MSGPPIPDDWTGPEALTIAAFLQRIARAIWDRHGDRMGRTLEQRYAQPRAEASPLEPPSIPSRMDDLPF